MPELVCTDCGHAHDPGMTGIDEGGRATCVECGGPVRTEGADAQ